MALIMNSSLMGALKRDHLENFTLFQVVVLSTAGCPGPGIVSHFIEILNNDAHLSQMEMNCRHFDVPNLVTKGDKNVVLLIPSFQFIPIPQITFNSFNALYCTPQRDTLLQSRSRA